MKVANMAEKDWVLSFIEKMQNSLQRKDKALKVEAAKKVIYAQEILRYNESDREGPSYNTMKYETDILISEVNPKTGAWIPRVIIEGKIRSINTHDAITYSRKAETHKNVHPYLRYGILCIKGVASLTLTEQDETRCGVEGFGPANILDKYV
jgi:hypothetical protein